MVNKIIILSVCSIILTAAAVLYMSYSLDIEEEKKLNVCIKKFFQKRLYIAYVVAMLAVLIAMSVSLSYFYHANTLIENARLIFMLAALFIAAWFDQRKNVIPNKLVASMFLVRIAFYVIEAFKDYNKFWSVFKMDLIAGLLILAFFIVGVLVVKNGIGMGDIKLLLAMAFYQGFYGVVSSVFISLIIVFIFSVGLLLTKKKNRKDTVAFAPSLLIGTTLSIFMTGM